jgi:DNA uptake protein ComE-like DNA-binding protein
MIRILRYVLLIVAIACLAIGLNNCTGTSSIDTASAPPTATSSVASSPNGTASNEPKININTAILSELDQLEAKLGIPALSNQIQASRPYGSIEDLVSKNVLTQEQFTQIQDQVTVEEILLTGEAKDVDYLTKLGLMKGHMMIAGQLLDLKLPKQAEPHLGHPVEEIYVDLAEQLPERNVPEFSAILTKTQDLVKSRPNDPQVKPTYDQAMAAVDQAIAALPANQLQSPSFVLKSITEILETAVAEYTAAISGGKISEVIEYQDSRGFVEYARDTLLKQIEPTLDAALASDLKIKMDELFKAWPEPVPPAAPVVSADEVANQVKAIEQAAAPAINS